MCKYTRLRQICLVAHDIGKVVDDLCDVDRVEVEKRIVQVSRNRAGTRAADGVVVHPTAGAIRRRGHQT